MRHRITSHIIPIIFINTSQISFKGRPLLSESYTLTLKSIVVDIKDTVRLSNSFNELFNMNVLKWLRLTLLRLVIAHVVTVSCDTVS